MFEGALMPTHWVVILVIVLIVFGAGKLPAVMGDLGRGVKEFKKAQEAPGPRPAGDADLALPGPPTRPVTTTPMPAVDGGAASGAADGVLEPTAGPAPRA